MADLSCVALVVRSLGSLRNPAAEGIVEPKGMYYASDELLDQLFVLCKVLFVHLL